MHQLPHLYPWVQHQSGVPPVVDLGRVLHIHRTARSGSYGPCTEAPGFDASEDFSSEASYEHGLVFRALQSTDLFAKDSTRPCKHCWKHCSRSVCGGGHRCCPNSDPRRPIADAGSTGFRAEWIYDPSDCRSGRAHRQHDWQRSDVRHAGQSAIRAARARRDL